LKILFYNHTGNVSGAERVLLMILKGLDRQLFDPVVLCPTDGRLTEMASEAGAGIIPIDQLTARFTWRVDYLLRYLASFVNVIRTARSIVLSEAPDLIHANSIRAGLVMSVATLGLKVPVVWHAHDILPRHPLSAAVRLVACATKRSQILAVSRAAAAQFRGHLINRSNQRVPVKVIHNAVDLERFQPNPDSRREIRRALGLTETQPVVGIVGHLTPNKGQLELIEAFAAIPCRTPDAVLLVVGEPLFNRGGDYEKSLVSTANSLGVADRVRFLGARDDVPAIMQGLDLLVVNSRTEACPLTVLEGLASGTPVLATAVGGTPEMICHGENGWLVPACDQQSLTQAMLLLLRNKNLRRELGSNGRREALARFGVEEFITKIISLYRSVAERGRTPHQESSGVLEVKLIPD
jgi:glycosyltransferase involved in cell wall biosynthesis